jgi:PAS domain S-box-containing protein
MLARATAEDYLQTAVTAAGSAEGCGALLDELPVPIYVTDADGQVTYWNRACIAFAGREPELGKDRWCVTWRLATTDGADLPHDQCPMAEAIRTEAPIRDAVAIAMRPDGSRRAFTPYPTPLFDHAGNLTGAVNMLVDVSDAQAEVLAEQAARCRRLSRATHDQECAAILKAMAGEYEDTAAALSSGAAKPN